MKTQMSRPEKKRADSFSTFLEIAQSISPKHAPEAFPSLEEEALLPNERSIEASERVSPEMEEETLSLGEGEHAPQVLRAVAEHQPISVVDLMHHCQLDFLKFARQVNRLAENGLLEITPSPNDPDTEIVRLSRRGRQIAAGLFNTELP